MIHRLKPTRLPPNPTFVDRLKHGLQWLLSWFVIHDSDHPLFSGMLTGLLLLAPIIGIATVISLVLGALSKLHL
jgi:hypothetical protein